MKVQSVAKHGGFLALREVSRGAGEHWVDVLGFHGGSQGHLPSRLYQAFGLQKAWWGRLKPGEGPFGIGKANERGQGGILSLASQTFVCLTMIGKGNMKNVILSTETFSPQLSILLSPSLCAEPDIGHLGRLATWSRLLESPVLSLAWRMRAS